MTICRGAKIKVKNTNKIQKKNETVAYIHISRRHILSQKKTKKIGDWLNSKYPYVCHAELNSICNKNEASLKNCVIYTLLFPCNECTKLIIQSQIKEIKYISNKYKDKKEWVAARKMLDLANIKYEQYIPKQSQIILKFPEC